MRIRPSSASCWARARVFTIRANQRNLSSLRLSATFQLGQRGEGVAGFGLASLVAPARAAAPHPGLLGLDGAEAELAHQPRHRLRLQAERRRERLVDHWLRLAGARLV